MTPRLETTVKEAPIIKEEKEGVKGFFIKLMGYIMDGKPISNRVSSKNRLVYGYISPEALKIVTDSLKEPYD
jgi:hypothetical protein